MKKLALSRFDRTISHVSSVVNADIHCSYIVNRLSVILTRGDAFFVYELDVSSERVQVGGFIELGFE